MKFENNRKKRLQDKTMFKFYYILLIQIYLVSLLCVKGASIGKSSIDDEENLLPNGNSLAFDTEDDIQLINGRPYFVIRQLVPVLIALKKPVSDITSNDVSYGNQMEKRAFKLLRVG